MPRRSALIANARRERLPFGPGLGSELPRMAAGIHPLGTSRPVQVLGRRRFSLARTG
jgi:hypothetical protein